MSSPSTNSGSSFNSIGNISGLGNLAPGINAVSTPLTKVKDLKAQDARQSIGFMSLLLVKKISEKTAKNGAPFLAVDLSDKTGSFGVILFSDTPYFSFFKTEAPEGSIVLFTGATAYYQERFSPKVADIRKLSADELSKYPTADLVPSSNENPAQMWQEITAHVAKIQHEKLRATVEKVLGEIEEAFRTWPAGIHMHHAYRHGLMEHTLHLCRAADALLPLYTEVDADLARAGILLHDTGKVQEYSYDLTTKFSRAGIMEGHVVIGYRLARTAALKVGLDEERLQRLEHIILSHQGELAFGAAVRAATPEALFVSLIDNMDAKMGAMQNALRNGNPGDEFSEIIPALGARMLLGGSPTEIGQ